MKIAIVDDEKIYRDEIYNLCLECDETNNYLFELFNCGEEFLEKYEQGERYDVLFIDIEMKTLTGLDVVEKINFRKDNVIVIFITSHTNYISNTLRLGAFQFLTKPINKDDFVIDFYRAVEKYKNFHKKYEIKTKNGLRIIDYKDISYLTLVSRRIVVVTDNLDKIEFIGTTLKNEFNKLNGFSFSKCHQGYIVNMEHIVSINKEDLTLKNNEKLPISRKDRSDFLDKYSLYMVGQKI